MLAFPTPTTRPYTDELLCTQSLSRNQQDSLVARFRRPCNTLPNSTRRLATIPFLLSANMADDGHDLQQAAPGTSIVGNESIMYGFHNT